MSWKPKVSAICVTYGRPHFLGEAIESFLRQDYQGEKEMIILNDDPTTTIIVNVVGVKVINTDKRFRSLGEKRNAACEAATGDILFAWDDDDISFPHRISLTLARMKNRQHFITDAHFKETDNGLTVQANFPLFGTCAFSKELFLKTQFPSLDNKEDLEFDVGVIKENLYNYQTLPINEIFYLYRKNSDTYHATDDVGEAVDKRSVTGLGEITITPKWKKEYGHPALPNPKILVGVCSCHGHEVERRTVRETWAKVPENVVVKFFVGKGDKLNEPDTVELKCEDDYISLPDKVIQFFRWALATSDFEYLFKCDDDTYVKLDRLNTLLLNSPDYVGNHFLGAPDKYFGCGGAGYMLSRKWVEHAVGSIIPRKGYEDRLIANAVLRSGATPTVSSLLNWHYPPYPHHNDLNVTAHHCKPEALRAIHANFEPIKVTKTLEVVANGSTTVVEVDAHGICVHKETNSIGVLDDRGDHCVVRWLNQHKATVISSSKGKWLKRCPAAMVWEVGYHYFITPPKTGWTNFRTSEKSKHNASTRAGIAMWRDPMKRVPSMYRDCFHKRMKLADQPPDKFDSVVALCKFYDCIPDDLPKISFERFVMDLPEIVEQDVDPHFSPIYLAVAGFALQGIAILDDNTEGLEKLLGLHSRNTSPEYCDVDTTITPELEHIIKTTFAGDYDLLKNNIHLKL